MREWILEWLAGNARSCVRRVKSISTKQLLGAQRASSRAGISVEESAATILSAATQVPNPDPDKMQAVRNLFG